MPEFTESEKVFAKSKVICYHKQWRYAEGGYMKAKDLKIEYVTIDEIKPYAGNAKLHPAEQIEQIKKSIEQFGMNDPIAVWKDGKIIEGHGRLIALQEMGPEKLKKLGIVKIPIIRLDNLTDKQRKAYALVHNQITLNSGFDVDLLNEELAGLEDFDMAEFGFDIDDISDEEMSHTDIYSKKTNIPQYEPTGEEVDLTDLVDLSKTEDLIQEINASDIPEDIKVFLREAAHRHSVFDYRNIAEYYAQADADVQRLMEKSALVIIDIDDAIANGFVRLTKRVQDLIEEEKEEAE